MHITTNIRTVSFNPMLLAIVAFCCLISFSCVQQPVTIKITSDDPMVQRFYSINGEQQFWMSSRKSLKNAYEWLAIVDSANNYGIVSDTLQIDQIRVALSSKNVNNESISRADQKMTGLVLDFLKQLQQSNIKFDYDEVAVKQSDSVYIQQLLNFNSNESASKAVSRIECNDPDYLALKRYMIDSITVKDTLKYKSVLLAMNYRKYLAMNHLSEYVLVNIPEVMARYYLKDKLSIEMRVVVGTKKSPTPTIASYITSIVTFPCWNVPHKIATTEILPKIQKDENYLEQHNFDVVDSKGNIINDSELDWKKYNQRTFPYFFRQSSGPDNSLGVLKFELQNPFSIFLHSTSWHGVFAKDFRFLSHGCIRLEKPIDLASALLRGKLDIEELKKAKKDTESKTLLLPEKIPVFIIYIPVTVVDQKVTFLNDVYGLIK